MKDDFDFFDDESSRLPPWLTFLLSSVVAILAYSLFAAVLYLIWRAIFND